VVGDWGRGGEVGGRLHWGGVIRRVLIDRLRLSGATGGRSDVLLFVVAVLLDGRRGSRGFLWLFELGLGSLLSSPLLTLLCFLVQSTLAAFGECVELSLTQDSLRLLIRSSFNDRLGLGNRLGNLNGGILDFLDFYRRRGFLNLAHFYYNKIFFLIYIFTDDSVIRQGLVP